MATRHQDNLHHWSDLVGGALLGTIINFIVYPFFYPSKCSKKQYNSESEALVNKVEIVNDGESSVSIFFFFFFFFFSLLYFYFIIYFFFFIIFFFFFYFFFIKR